MGWLDPSLLPWAQFLGLGLLGIVAAFGHWFGKRREVPPPTSKDVVVNSMTVADSAAIARLADELREDSRNARNRQEYERKMLFETEQSNGNLSDVKHLLATMVDQQRRILACLEANK